MGENVLERYIPDKLVFPSTNYYKIQNIFWFCSVWSGAEWGERQTNKVLVVSDIHTLPAHSAERETSFSCDLSSQHSLTHYPFTNYESTALAIASI